MGSWEYSGDPSTSDKDAMRFLLGDTNEADQQMSDEEIEYLLAEHGGVGLASVAAANALALRFARLVDKSVGDLRISLSQRHQHYADLAKHLESSSAASSHPVPILTGRSVADKVTAEQDIDRVEPGFRVGMDDRDGDFRDDPRWGGP